MGEANLPWKIHEALSLLIQELETDLSGGLAVAYSLDMFGLVQGSENLEEDSESYVTEECCSLDLSGMFQISSCFVYGLEAYPSWHYRLDLHIAEFLEGLC